MQLGAHAVLFTDRIKSDPENVLDMIKSSGAEAFEMGARFFGVDNAFAINKLIQNRGLNLSGLHIGIPLVDFVDNFEDVKIKLVNGAKFLSCFNYKNIIMTGGIPNEHYDSENLGDVRLLDGDFVKSIALRIEECCLMLKQDFEVTLNYHNHNWEFKNNSLIFNTLFETAKSLKFALDIGWVAVSGLNPLEVIKSDTSRFLYLHLRDYKLDVDYSKLKFKEIAESFCEIGEGDMDIKELFGFLNKYMTNDDFCIVEYEKGQVDIVRYKKALDVINSVLSTL